MFPVSRNSTAGQLTSKQSSKKIIDEVVAVTLAFHHLPHVKKY